MGGGDVEGFAAVAFPIVRRVFGGLVANNLVSVQPMSLPSGLIFFLDFTYTNGVNGIFDSLGKYTPGSTRINPIEKFIPPLGVSKLLGDLNIEAEK